MRAEVQLHSFSTSAPDGGKWSPSRIGLFTSGKKRRYPLKRMLGGPHSRSERFGEQKTHLALPGFEPQTVQPVA